MSELWKLFSIFFRIGLFTVGGGYAMLPMLTKEIVTKQKWLDEKELLNVFAIGQSTPGIIAINVATFVGTRQKGFIGALVATFGMVLPSLVIILLLATSIQSFKDNEYLLKAFAGIRVAVAAMLAIIVVKFAKKTITDAIGATLMASGFCAIVFFGAPTYVVITCGGLIGILFYTIKAKRQHRDAEEISK